MRNMIPLGLSVLILFACQTASEGMTEEDLASVAGEVREETIDLCDSWNTLDPAIHLRHYSQDMRWGGNGGFLVGEDFRSAIGSFMGMFSRYDQRWQDIDVQVLEQDVAVASVKMSVNTVGRNGDVSEGVEAMTLVWQRRPEGWRVVAGHTSSR